MDADRVRSYLQVACAGLGFDIGEVWWMSNESGTSTVAAIEERHDSDSESTGSGSGSGYHGLVSDHKIEHSAACARGGVKAKSKKRAPKKRFLQLYTSKAYCNQRSKLVQPHETDGAARGTDANGRSSSSPPSSPGSPANGKQLSSALRRSSSSASLELDEEHVLSPRIVEAVTHSTQVVWANCQKTEGLLGRSDIRLQTAIGMPVGVDEGGNVWVVVMFSPKNVESTADAIDYLQYVSRSAASTSIPCLLPVVGDADPEGTEDGTKMLADGNAEEYRNGNGAGHGQGQGGMHHSHSLVSIKPDRKQPDHTEEIGDGVTAKFVSFNINDDEEDKKSPSRGGTASGGAASPGGPRRQRAPSNDLRHAPRDDWGIPILPDETDAVEVNAPGALAPIPGAQTPNRGANLSRQNSLDPRFGRQSSMDTQMLADAIDGAIADAFDEASYGVWSTVINSAVGAAAAIGPPIATAANGTVGGAIQAGAGGGPAEASRRGSAVDPAPSPAETARAVRERLEEFATAFLGMSVFDVADAWTPNPAGDGTLRCLFTGAATETNPGINALRDATGRAAVRTGDGAVGRAYGTGYPVWSSVKELIYDQERRGVLENCKIETAFAVPIFSSSGGVSPQCILCCYSLLPAESVPFVLNFVQKAVRLLWGGLDRVSNPHESVGRELWKDVGPADLGEMAADVEMQKAFIGKKRPRSASLAASQDGRDCAPSLVAQMNVLPSLGPTPASEPCTDTPINAPPDKGLAPAPQLPHSVQDCAPNAQFIFLNSSNDGHWAVQQAVQSVGDVQPWNDGEENNTGGYSPANQFNYAHPPEQQQLHHQPQLPLQPPPQPATQQQLLQPPQYQMCYINYSTQEAAKPPAPTAPFPQPGVHTDDPATIHANLVEFNAMAQMHNVGQYQSPGAQGPTNNGFENGVSNGIQQPGYLMPNQPQPMANFASNNGNNSISTDKMVVIPLGPTEGSVILTGPQQGMMYCNPATSAPSPVATGQIHPGPLAVGTKPCRIQGCDNFAVAKRPYCERHCGNRQCESQGCTKCAQGATRFCIAHGGGRRCTFPGCDKGARDKFFCAAHGGGKRCKKEGCTKSAVGGSNFCTGHGGGKRCEVPGCDKSAQSSTRFCVKHGGGKKCQHRGCGKVARGRTQFCAAHGGGVRCKLEGCNRVAIGKAQLCRAHGGGANSHLQFHAAAI
ncbi:hypothetical protein ACHAWF_013071 [Thalassiosira exigua]